MALKMQYCFNCGAQLGVYDSFPGDLEICDKLECERAARDAYRARNDEAQTAAEEDNYGRYGGGW